MLAPVQPIRQEALANQDLIDFLEKTLARAKAGELKAIVAIVESREDRYEHTRINVTYEAALGLYTRAAYRLNQDWSNS